MQLNIETFTVTKRFPLTISRGTATGNTNIWLKIKADQIEGWGEATPFSIGKNALGNPQKLTIEKLISELKKITPKLTTIHPLEQQKIKNILQKNHCSSATCAAIDTALQDWLGKYTNLPLWKLWGLNRENIVPTSVTIGISSPEKAQERVKKWQDFIQAKHFKIKLGSPEGITADQAMFLAIKDLVPDAELTVDANGGWTLEDAVIMAEWLAEQGVRHLEQPLAVTDEKSFPILFEKSPLPLFADESCWTRRDIPRLAPWFDGINIKMMKAGGLTEAMGMIQVAKAFDLQIMFGCYSDSVLSNSAIAHLTPFAHYVDLDSHLNLINDPFTGATLDAGRLMPNDLPGLGVSTVGLAE